MRPLKWPGASFFYCHSTEHGERTEQCVDVERPFIDSILLRVPFVSVSHHCLYHALLCSALLCSAVCESNDTISKGLITPPSSLVGSFFFLFSFLHHSPHPIKGFLSLPDYSLIDPSRSLIHQNHWFTPRSWRNITRTTFNCILDS